MKIYYEPEKNNEQPVEHTLQGHDIHTETKNQHEKMKDKPLKEKVAYYFGYYKFHALGALLICFVIYSIIHAVVTSKNYCFGAMIVNSANIDNEKLSESFAEYADFDTNKYECYILANESESLGTGSMDAASFTRFAALLSSKDLDITIYDSSVFYRKAIESVYLDLTTVLSPEDIEKYKDNFYYIDKKDIEEAVRRANDPDADNNNNTSPYRLSYEEAIKDVETHRDPSSMSNPIPVGIIIEDAPFITTLDAYYDSIPVLGIITNSERIPSAVEFIHYIYDENVNFESLQLYEQ